MEKIKHIRLIPVQIQKINRLPPKDKETFEKIFVEALKNGINKVNKLQREADEAVKDLVLGKAENIHDVMIALQKADVSFRLVMQIRNKVVEAYQEIIRMAI